MNRIIFLLAILVAVSCGKDKVALTEEPLMKMYGLEGSSSLEKVWEYKNGSGYLMVGKYSTNAFSLGNLGTSLPSENSDVIIPAIVRTDSKGNVIEEHPIPISDIERNASVNLTSVDNLANFTEVFPLSNGKYLVFGEFRGIGFYYQNLNLDPSWSNRFHFYVILNAQFQLEKIELLTVQEQNWDRWVRSGLIVKPNPEGGFLALQSFAANPALGNPYPQQFQLLNFDETGNLTTSHEYQNGADFRFARDFTFSGEDIVLIGQTTFDSIGIFRIDRQTMVETEFISLHADGVFGSFNNNPMHIQSLPDSGFILLYTNPTSETILERVDKNFKVVYSFDTEPGLDDQYFVQCEQARNGDLLVLTNNNSLADFQKGYLYRYNTNGKEVFRRVIDGPPRDITEAIDGSLLLLSDLPYNGYVVKATLQKLTAHGTLQ